MQRLPDFCCPCGNFGGWKQIRLRGKRLSRSYSDLHLLGASNNSKGWVWDSDSSSSKDKGQPPTPPAPGNAPIERLPPEIQSGLQDNALLGLLANRYYYVIIVMIISNLSLDIPPNGYTPRNVDLISCLLVSRTMHAATLSVLYRTMTFPHSSVFSKALNHLRRYPALGTLVRRLDLSHLTSVGLGRTGQMNSEIQNLTSETLLEFLNLLPNLKEALFQEHVEGDISVEVIQKLLSGLSNMAAVDFCGCCAQSFSAVFREALLASHAHSVSSLPNIKRISLHECSSLSASTFEALLPRLVNLTHFDATRTQISNAALFSIPKTARITHLSLSRCTRLTGSAVVEFLTTHPAVSSSVVFLNLMADKSRHQLLNREDLKTLLPRLPSSLRSLNLGGAEVTGQHISDLTSLTKHLEELGLDSADLSANDLNRFFAPVANNNNDWIPSSLRYLDLTKVPRLSVATLYNTYACLLLSESSYPLVVLEFADKIITPLREQSKVTRGSGTGWTVRELGRRGWYVRDTSLMSSPPPPDDGTRGWKMGARWWGMRKIPVAVAEVGGIYGHYMFKK